MLIEHFKFVCIVYAKWWIRYPLPAECGLLDLQLLREICLFPDNVISIAAEKALLRHLWYLTLEQAPRCLFSSYLSDDKKEDIRLQLLMILLGLKKDDDSDDMFTFERDQEASMVSLSSRSLVKLSSMTSVST